MAKKPKADKAPLFNPKVWSEEIIKAMSVKSWGAAAAAAAGGALSKAPPPPPSIGIGPGSPFSPYAAAMPEPLITKALREELQGWLDAMYNEVGKQHGHDRFKFRPIIIVTGDSQFAAHRGAQQYRFTTRVDLMTRDGRELKAPKDEDRCIDLLVEAADPFPLTETAANMKRDLITQFPHWWKRYETRNQPVEDEPLLFHPGLLYPPMPGVVLPGAVIPVTGPMPGSIAHGASSYSKAYAEMMGSKIKAQAAEDFKVRVDTLYGYAPPPREKKP